MRRDWIDLPVFILRFLILRERRGEKGREMERDGVEKGGRGHIISQGILQTFSMDTHAMGMPHDVDFSIHSYLSTAYVCFFSDIWMSYSRLYHETRDK